MDLQFVKDFLRVLGFDLSDGSEGLWCKKYPLHNDYSIKAILNKSKLGDCKIDYGKSIKIGRNTTTNFSKPENLVVLECIDRLLNKGYKPNHIELEKRWRVGGILDILVRDDSGKSYLMIECKRWGAEYNTAIKIILQNEFKKEQLFNYYLQEKSTRFVALYSSHITEDSQIVFRNDIIFVKPFRNCDNQQEIYDTWDKVFQYKGIFESNINPYQISFSGITKGDLKTLEHADIDESGEGTIYNRFAEILRRHTVSDKTNAYNKIFNLFLCKIRLVAN